MSIDSGKRIRELFDQAVDLAANDRATLLAEECGSDVHLRLEVESLLAEHDQSPEFLEPSVDGGAACHATGKRIDGSHAFPEVEGYRVIRLLGEGGMGVVYEVEQHRPRRRLALKVIRWGEIADARLLHLFEREEHSLARLRHPRIAAIYGAGVTRRGEPYLTMELIRGIPLDHHVKQTAPDIRARLALFLEVCDAIKHAHERGVIHRDLKPGNILVDSDGHVRVLDFGLARITAPDTSVTATVTEVGKVQGTLSYMSPEQARGDPDAIDLRSDVYSLGVILFELMTDRLPYDVRSTALHEAVRVICEFDPPRPHSVCRQLTRDLDAIILKALHKDPAHRYQSVAALSEDLERYLANEPVLARAPSASYQLKKLVQRHKAPFAAAVLVFVILVFASIWLSLLYQKTERLRMAESLQRERAVANLEQAEDARERERAAAATADRTSRFLQQILASASPERARGRDITILRELLEDAAARTERELRDEPAVAAAVHSTVGSTYRALGLYDEAEPHLQRALKLRRNLDGVDARDLAANLNDMALLLKRKGQLDAAEPLYREALAINRAYLGPRHPNVEVALNNLAVLLKSKEAYDEAETTYREALSLSRTLDGDHDLRVARGLQNLASLLRVQGRYHEAEPLYREALEIYERRGDESNPRLAATLADLSLLLAETDRLHDADAMGRRAVALNRRIVGDHHPRTARSLDALGRILRRKGELDGAEAAHREALANRRTRLEGDHPSVLSSMNNLALVLRQQGEYEEAASLYREAIRVRQNRLDPDHPAITVPQFNLAVLCAESGDLFEAERLFRIVLSSRRETLGDAHPDVAEAQEGLAVALCELGRPDEAVPLYREAVAIREKTKHRDGIGLAHTHYRLAEALEQLGRDDEALLHYRSGLALDEAPLGKEDEKTLSAMVRLIEHQISVDGHEFAEAFAIECVERHRLHYGRTHARTQKAERLLERVIAHKAGQPHEDPNSAADAVASPN